VKLSEIWLVNLDPTVRNEIKNRDPAWRCHRLSAWSQGTTIYQKLWAVGVMDHVAGQMCHPIAVRALQLEVGEVMSDTRKRGWHAEAGSWAILPTSPLQSEAP
jgi:hypothetical protein